MSDFISVLGESPFYSGMRIRMWLARHTIARIYPQHAVKGEDGNYWKSTPDHEGAEIISYLLIDHSGQEFYCSEAELQELGVQHKAPTPTIGFVMNEGGDTEAVALSDAGAGTSGNTLDRDNG